MARLTLFLKSDTTGRLSLCQNKETSLSSRGEIAAKVPD